VRASLDRDLLKLEVAEGHWQGAHAAVAGTVPARFLKVPGASEGGKASLTGHVDDVTIKVLYCGICHTDLHVIKNEWGNAMYPVVPG